MNLELKSRIVETNIDVVDINGFKYNLHMMELGTLPKFKVLFPIFDDVSVGDCFKSTKWVLTRLGTEKPADLCVRVDEFEYVRDANFEPNKYLNTRVKGLFLSSDKCYLRTVGPDAKPFYMATLKLTDSHGESYENVLVAFCDCAKRLSTVKSKSVIECEVTVKLRKEHPGYEFALCKLEVKSEGK